MKDTFTMEEFCEKHGLQVDMNDPGATKLVAARLMQLGYRPKKMRIDGSPRRVWTKRDTALAELKEKLAAIKE